MVRPDDTGGSGDSLETDVPGTAGDLRAVATWLRRPLATRTDTLASTLSTQRTALASDWQGQAGTAFQSRSRTLITAADSAHDTFGLVATEVDVLATALDHAHTRMSTVRGDARAGGLTVSGTVVQSPGAAPPEAGVLPAGATAAETTQWNAANRAVEAHNAKVRVWNTAVTDADDAFGDWRTAVNHAADTWRTYSSELVGVSADFLTAGAEITLIAKTVPVLVRESQESAALATRLRTHAADLTLPDGTVVDRPGYYDLLDRADALDTRAATVYDDAVGFELPKGIGRGLGILGVAAAGYGIYSDIQSGESPTQAVVVNTVSFGASVAAGAAIGGMVGTAIPVPIVGTVAGVVVGAVVGTVVGAFTSGFLDSVWEHGLDDAGGAVMDGIDEVGATGAAIGDLATDAWDAIF